MQQADSAHSATGRLASSGNLSTVTTNVIAFPDTAIARARRELKYCRNQSMLIKWCGRVKRDPGLSGRDRMNLVSLFAIRQGEIASAGER